MSEVKETVEKHDVKKLIKELLIEMLSSGEVKVETKVKNKIASNTSIITTTTISMDGETVYTSNVETKNFHFGNIN